MPLSRDFRFSVKKRAAHDPAYRNDLLREAMEELLSGDAKIGRTILRDCVHATIGFAGLGDAMHRSPKSLMRMLGPDGNPQADNLLQILAVLQKEMNVHFKVKVIHGR